MTSLSNGFCVGGDRETMIEYLAHMDYDDAFAQRLRQSQDLGLLTTAEVERVLATTLRHPSLPPLIERPASVPALPFARSRSLAEPYRQVPSRPAGEQSKG